MNAQLYNSISSVPALDIANILIGLEDYPQNLLMCAQTICRASVWFYRMSKYEYLVSGLRDDAAEQRRFCIQIFEACVQTVKHENMDKK